MPLSQRAKDISSNIIEQMGGHRTLNIMLGLKQVGGAVYYIDEKDNGDVRLQFDFKVKNAAQVKRLAVTYINVSDTYSMEFWKSISEKQLVATIGWTPAQLAEKFRVAKYDNVYCNDLCRLFSETTGLSLQVPSFA